MFEVIRVLAICGAKIQTKGKPREESLTLGLLFVLEAAANLKETNEWQKEQNRSFSLSQGKVGKV